MKQIKNNTLDDISAVIGLSATVRLAAWFGGLSRLYVPSTVEDGQLLVKLIGMPAAKRMTTEWGGTFLVVARLTTYEDELLRNMIGSMFEAGLSIRKIARHSRMTPRRVQQICRELEQVGLIKVVVPKQKVPDANIIHRFDMPSLFASQPGLAPVRC